MLACACSRHESGERQHAAATSPSPSPSASPSASPPIEGHASAEATPPDAARDAEAITPDAARDDEAAYARGTPRSAKSIGHTSVVFKVALSTGDKAVFKPASRRGPLRYKGEIAAHRLAVALGLHNVPRAIFRVFEASAMQAALGSAPPPGADLFAREAIVTGGRVKGALIPWIEGLDFLALESEPLASEWKRWLRSRESIPDDRRALARDVSTLVAFDFVTGNWDRWSGGNVGRDKASGMLLFIDNDGAFFEAPPADALQRNEKLLLGIERFSRSFVTRLRELDDAALARAVGEEAPGVPLLSSKALAGVAQRRTRLLQIIDARMAEAGAPSGEGVLAFP